MGIYSSAKISPRKAAVVCATDDGGFSGITLALSDAFYIMLKAVLINGAFALGLLISPLFSKDKAPSSNACLSLYFT